MYIRAKWSPTITAYGLIINQLMYCLIAELTVSLVESYHCNAVIVVIFQVLDVSASRSVSILKENPQEILRRLTADSRHFHCLWLARLPIKSFVDVSEGSDCQVCTFQYQCACIHQLGGTWWKQTNWFNDKNSK